MCAVASRYITVSMYRILFGLVAALSLCAADVNTFSIVASDPATGDCGVTVASKLAGALVANVAAGGPAGRAGIKTGDVIAAIDGTVVDDPNSFDYRFATKPLGGSAQVTLLRQGREMTVAVGLQTAPESPRNEVEIQARSPFTGAKVANLSPALADELRLDTAAQGVVITSVADGSTAQTIGFRKGDIVLSVNNQKIEKSADLDRVTRAGGRSWRVTINRGGQEISVMFSG